MTEISFIEFFAMDFSLGRIETFAVTLGFGGKNKNACCAIFYYRCYYGAL